MACYEFLVKLDPDIQEIPNGREFFTGNHINFEQADTDNNTEWFESHWAKFGGIMVYHTKKVYPTFDLKNEKTWAQDTKGISFNTFEK